MKCAICGGELVYKVGTHHYIECGLDAVYLEGIDTANCKKCKESYISLPRVPELHNLIGQDLIQKKTLLNGNEIRFFRKNLGLSSKKFAKILSVDNATLSRWEHDRQEPTTAHDRLIRLIYASIKELPIDKIRHLVENEFVTIEPRKGTMKKTLIPMVKFNKNKTACIPF
jgi:putative zinc finger/helix-turn-helix YgiT family protein